MVNIVFYNSQQIGYGGGTNLSVTYLIMHSHSEYCPEYNISFQFVAIQVALIFK